MATTAPFSPMVYSPAFVDDRMTAESQMVSWVDRFGPPFMKISDLLAGFRLKLGRILEQYWKARQ